MYKSVSLLRTTCPTHFHTVCTYLLAVNYFREQWSKVLPICSGSLFACYDTGLRVSLSGGLTRPHGQADALHHSGNPLGHTFRLFIYNHGTPLLFLAPHPVCVTCRTNICWTSLFVHSSTTANSGVYRRAIRRHNSSRLTALCELCWLEGNHMNVDGEWSWPI
jgi:hypothetical protein